MHALLLVYKDCEGHCNVPTKHEEDGKKLGQWLSDQRKLQKKKKLNPEKEKQLEKIGVVWDAREWKLKNKVSLLLNSSEIQVP